MIGPKVACHVIQGKTDGLVGILDSAFENGNWVKQQPHIDEIQVYLLLNASTSTTSKLWHSFVPCFVRKVRCRLDADGRFSSSTVPVCCTRTRVTVDGIPGAHVLCCQSQVFIGIKTGRRVDGALIKFQVDVTRIDRN